MGATKDQNLMLLDEMRYWTENIFIKFVKDDTDGGKYKLTGQNQKDKRRGSFISCPFYMGLSPEYICKERDGRKMPRLMVVGQEALGYGKWIEDGNKFSYEPVSSQEWAIEFTRVQLGEKGVNEGGRYTIRKKNTRFWNAIRLLSEKFVICWNNLDKAYFGDGKQGSLTVEGEKNLSRRYLRENEIAAKSILEREIEIAKPDYLLFFTGPNYFQSMETAFGAETKFEGALTLENPIVDLNEMKHITGIPTYWTYHPNNRVRVNSAQLFLEKVNALTI